MSSQSCLYTDLCNHQSKRQRVLAHRGCKQLTIPLCCVPGGGGGGGGGGRGDKTV